jgi:ferredoxin
MTQLEIVKVWIDADECLSHQLCIEDVASIFEFPVEAISAQVKPNIDRGLLAQNSERLLLAAARCPVAAIKLKLLSGTVVDGDSEVVKMFVASNYGA